MMKLHSINKEHRRYVMPCGSGLSCYGFDVLDRKGRELTAELLKIGQVVESWTECKGTKKAFHHFARINKIAAEINKRTGYCFEYELNKQLTGLYRCRVEVVTLEGETRRFWVGRSTGWSPIYLEILRRDSTGGAGCDSEYKSVKVINYNKRRS